MAESEEQCFECDICYNRRIVSFTPQCGHPICSVCIDEIYFSSELSNRCSFCRASLPDTFGEYSLKSHPFPESISAQEVDSEFTYLCATGDMEKIETAVQKGADVNKIMQDGKTPIIISVEYKFLEVVKFLQKNGADVNVPSRLETNVPFLKNYETKN